MAGHSKWANIQYRKNAQDKKKAKAFSRLSREITTAVRLGGGPDADSNPRLRMAIRAARAESMPKDNITRAIEKASGADSDSFEDIRYEGFAPGGVGLIVEVSTDNRNRAASDVRAVFGKHGGSMAETGSVSFGFDQLGQIVYPAEAASQDTIIEAALDAGAQDVESSPHEHIIYSGRNDLMRVSTALEGAFGDIDPLSISLVWRPATYIEVDPDAAEKLVKLLEGLDALDDVQNVFGNFAFTDPA